MELLFFNCFIIHSKRQSSHPRIREKSEREKVKSGEEYREKFFQNVKKAQEN